MCIRDRPQDLKDKFTEDDLYYILDVIVDYYTSSGCPVSYTHLDVYKRQTQWLVKRGDTEVRTIDIEASRAVEDNPLFYHNVYTLSLIHI